MRGAVLTVAVTAAMAITVAPAAASTFFAAPDGDGPFPCAKADPCSLEAASTAAGSGDEVVVLPGTYQLAATVEVRDGVDLHGRRKRPATLRAPDAPLFSPFEARVAHLVLESEGGPAFNAGLGETTFENLAALTAAPNPMVGACTVPEAPGHLRDVVCVNQGAGPGIALSVFAGATLTIEYRLVNVTAVALSGSSTAAHGALFHAGGSLTMRPHIANSIFVGGQAAYDIHTERGATTAGVAAEVESSNLDLPHSEPGTTITLGGGNQTASPVFADPAAFDFRQLATSPTVDAGTATPPQGELGSFDFEGEMRRFGGIPDIGADEFTGILRARAKRRQRARRLTVVAECPLTACRVKVRARGYEAERERLRASRPERIRLAPADGVPDARRVVAKVGARDTVGARATKRLRIRLG